MSDLAPLHDLLSEMVQAYSQKNQAPHIPTPAEIGTHLHPLLDRMCEEAEKRNASDIFISADFPPAIKVGGTLTPMPHKALTGADTAAIAESTMNPARSLQSRLGNQLFRPIAQQHALPRQRLPRARPRRHGIAPRQPRHSRDENPRFARKAPRACTRAARPAYTRRPDWFG